ncbi:MAG TPA: Gfo/Idh/MocA family oxidoreductase [Bryobacteraceae bacterium]|nr:Gfo/Idh/MocA family oxidoreductase [Bryobacteraceae bacterium]HPQ16300.1 Gfo/Idh/MocA family oxidoreductase [Bryobacteraceae bacterium]
MAAKSSRRGFLGGSVALPSVFAQTVLGANDRINIAVIGVGAHAYAHHVKAIVGRRDEDNVRLTAICDVYRRRVTRALAIAKEAEGFLDYRRLLDRKDIDAVVIATPDHWHAKMSIDAMEAGKHVYCEKPMTLTIEQAFAVRDTVHKTKKVYTVGPQGTANAAYWHAQAAIREGKIGKVIIAQAGGGRSERVHTYDSRAWSIDPDAGPDRTGEDYIDWDMWLGWRFGLAPKIPFNPEHYFRFRKYWPYSGGQASDLLYHSLAPLLLAIAGPNGAYPTRVTATGGLYAHRDGRDIPDTYVTSLDYAGEYTILLVNCAAASVRIPTTICGRYGSIQLAPSGSRRWDPHNDLILRAEGDFLAEFQERNNGSEEVEIPLERHRDIMGCFLDAIRGQGTVTCNVELGTATMVGIKLGVDAYRQSKTMLWPPPGQTAQS